MKRPLLVALPLSVAVHLAAGAVALLLLTRESPPPPLFIDLTADAPVETPTTRAPSAAPRDTAPVARQAPRRRAEEPAPRQTVSARTSRPDEASPRPDAPAVDARPSPPVPETREPEPQMPASAPEKAVTTAPLPAPAATASPAPSAPPVAAAGGGSKPTAMTPGTSVQGGRADGGDTAGDSGDRGARAGAGDAGVAGVPDRTGAAVAAATTRAGTGVEDGPYHRAIRHHMRELLEYPASIRRRGLSGRVEVEVFVLANGVIGDVTLYQSSSEPLLDEAALAAVKRLPPVRLPRDLPPREIRVRVPVVFELR